MTSQLIHDEILWKMNVVALKFNAYCGRDESIYREKHVFIYREKHVFTLYFLFIYVE